MNHKTAARGGDRNLLFKRMDHVLSLKGRFASPSEDILPRKEIMIMLVSDMKIMETRDLVAEYNGPIMQRLIGLYFSKKVKYMDNPEDSFQKFIFERNDNYFSCRDHTCSYGYNHTLFVVMAAILFEYEASLSPKALKEFLASFDCPLHPNKKIHFK